MELKRSLAFVGFAQLLLQPLAHGADTSPSPEATTHHWICLEREILDYQKEISPLLENKDFDRLEQVVSELRKGKPRLSSGLPKLRVFYDTFSSYLPSVMAEPLVAEWLKARPQSAAALVASARLHRAAAYEARSSRWAKDVPDEGWQVQAAELSQAREQLRSAASAQPDDPQIYADTILCAFAQGSLDEAVKALEAGIKVDREYDELYKDCASYLLHRWYGRPGAAEAFAVKAAESSGDETMYTRVALRVASVEHADVRAKYDFALLRIGKGCSELTRRYPDSSAVATTCLQMAWYYQDKALATELARQLGDLWNEDQSGTWGNREAYRRVVEWALGEKPKPSNAGEK